jgi:hypothetical protein
MAKRLKMLPVLIKSEFDYGSLKPAHAEKLQRAARCIIGKINKSIRELIEAGRCLVEVKDMLPHGQFGTWIEAEFGWSYRTARRLMDLAEQFGPKIDIVADLSIPPTTLYLLAAPSTPYEARQIAIDRAEAGETISVPIANEIISSVRKVKPRKGKTLPLDRLLRGLKVALNRFQERFGPDKVLEFARQLRDYASSLESAGIGARPKSTGGEGRVSSQPVRMRIGSGVSFERE